MAITAVDTDATVRGRVARGLDEVAGCARPSTIGDMLPESAPELSPAEVVIELIALSVVEHTNTEDLSISIELGDRQATISDTGRGMKITPDEGDTVSHAEKALTSIYPVVPTDPEIEQLLTELVWGERGSLGPSRANASCTEFRFSSRRGGEEWMQVFQSGAPVGPPQRVGSAESSGTTVELTTSGPIGYEVVDAFAEQLRTRIDGLQLVISTKR